MSKNFFVVVSYSSSIVKTNILKPKTKVAKKEDIDSFEETRSQLEQRIGIVVLSFDLEQKT